MFNKKFNAKKEEAESPLETSMTFIAAGLDLEKRIIELRGEVSDDMASYLTRALMKLTELNHEPITIYLSSPGGDAYESFAIYDAITKCPCDVKIVASGKIMSAGFLIMLAGDTRVAMPHTTFMMHSVISPIPEEATVKQQEVDLAESKRINAVFLEIATARTKRNKKWWQRMVLDGKDRYFTVNEAMDIGVLTPPRIPIKSVIKKVKGKK